MNTISRKAAPGIGWLLDPLLELHYWMEFTASRAFAAMAGGSGV